MLQQEEARYNSADLNIAYKMSVDEYQRLCPFAEALEENWGKPPGEASVCWHREGCQHCHHAEDLSCHCCRRQVLGASQLQEVKPVPGSAWCYAAGWYSIHPRCSVTVLVSITVPGKCTIQFLVIVPCALPAARPASPLATCCLCAAGKLNSQGQNLLVYGKQFGNVFIGVQPTFGYEGDPMALLFSRSASPHHGFAAYYTYLEHIFQVRQGGH